MTLRAPFRFDIVGSFLRPARLKKAREQFAKGEIAALDLKQVEDEEIARLIEKQKAAGLHTLTDGEFRRSYWHLDFFWGLQGITHIELDHGYFFHGEETTKGTAIVTGRISGEDHPFVEHFKYVKQFEDEKYPGPPDPACTGPAAGGTVPGRQRQDHRCSVSGP